MDICSGAKSAILQLTADSQNYLALYFKYYKQRIEIHVIQNYTNNKKKHFGNEQEQYKAIKEKKDVC